MLVSLQGRCAPSGLATLPQLRMHRAGRLGRPGLAGLPQLARPSRAVRRAVIHTKAVPRAQQLVVPKEVKVRFKLAREVKYGQSYVIVGDHSSLGNWKVRKAPAMGWNDGHVWRLEVALPPGASVEFKCVRVSKRDEEEEWEEGPNHVLRVPAAGVRVLDVELDWGEGLEVTSEGLPEPSAGERGGSGSEGSAAGSFVTSSGSSFEERLPSENWQGRNTVFMQSNEHSRDRQGVWRTDGLHGPLLRLVEGDRDNGSWLGKLAVVKNLLVDSSPRQRPDLDTLASVYVYTQWISTGAVPCVESGGHQRPNRHAEISRLCFRSLEWAIEDAAKGPYSSSAAAVGLVARRLHTRMPSFTEAFTASVPLTRIRDIAHRNDIPSDLKREIKHTIQNKLHRNAGPEDLVATEEMLRRITATPGQYPSAFIAEFKTFTAELRDFFNAGSLGDMLAALQPSIDGGHWQLVERFLAAKAKLDGEGPDASPNTLMDALHGVTSVRALLGASLSSGLRNDAPNNAMAMRQRYRLCEVRAEDYAFVLLSRFFNQLEEKGGAAALAAGSDSGWGLPIGTLVLGLRHIGLCGFEAGECMAVERELTAWQKAGGLSQKENALRLRATLQRLQRITEAYVAVLMEAYTDRAQKLGNALGLDPYLITVFSEAEIRASVVFQLSKLCSLLLRATGMVAGGLDDWEVIVGGEARGTLIEVDELQPGCLDKAGGKSVVALVKEASGDEEVSALGPQLKGVILRHAIPHLSHLGVRARQERVPFVCCEDELLLREVAQPLVGKRVKLEAGSEGARLLLDTEAEDTAASSSSNGSGARKAAAQPAPVQKVSGVMRLIELEDATAALCGAKGAACGELLRLAKHCDEALLAGAAGSAAMAAIPGSSSPGQNGSGAGALFCAPNGVCLPFGCMEVALQAENKMGEFEGLLRRLEDGGGDVEEACRQMQALILGLRMPQQVLQQVSGAFKPGATVICRSSANVEDLAGMSGAGLYDSIPNVDSNDLEGLGAAIASVWASLYTRRAVLSRRAAGVPQASACMSVVVQSMLAPDLSFVLHTAHPISRDPATLAAELAPGLGETLAAGTRGSGWRLEIDKASGKVTTKAFANFSRALLPSDPQNGASRSGPQGGERVAAQLVDYSEQPMSAQEEVRSAVGRRLTAVGRLLEHEFGGAQDVEGCFAGGQLYVVQTRPQP